jgi:hypothetical protein
MSSIEVLEVGLEPFSFEISGRAGHLDVKRFGWQLVVHQRWRRNCFQIIASGKTDEKGVRIELERGEFRRGMVVVEVKGRLSP